MTSRNFKNVSVTDIINGQVNDITNHSVFIKGLLSASGDLAYDAVTGVVSFTKRTDAEVKGLLSASGDLAYDAVTGVVSFTKRTDAEVKGLLSAAGDLSYNATTGVVSFTERTDAEVKGLLSAAGDLSYNATTGVVSFTERTESGVKGLLTAGNGLTYDNTTGVFTIDTSVSATKEYVDSIATGLDIKTSVRLGTTVAGNLSTDYINGVSIDGVVLVTGDRLLIKNQTNALENGIYSVNASGNPTRTVDMDESKEVKGAFTFIEAGVVNQGVGWVQTGDGVITIGTSDIIFTQFSKNQTNVGGEGISVEGNTISVTENSIGFNKLECIKFSVTTTTTPINDDRMFVTVPTEALAYVYSINATHKMILSTGVTTDSLSVGLHMFVRHGDTWVNDAGVPVSM
jgi:hypothetical protein